MLRLLISVIAMASTPALAGTSAPIPEPGPLSLLVLGVTGLVIGRRLSRR